MLTELGRGGFIGLPRQRSPPTPTGANTTNAFQHKTFAHQQEICATLHWFDDQAELAFLRLEIELKLALPGRLGNVAEHPALNMTTQ
jgi:hypothetical protein